MALPANGGGNGEVAISCSTRHIEGLFKDDDDAAKVYFEIRGVLLHELTHVYQQEPQGDRFLWNEQGI